MFSKFFKKTVAPAPATVNLSGLVAFGETLAILAKAVSSSEIAMTARYLPNEDRYAFNNIEAVRITRATTDGGGTQCCAIEITSNGNTKIYGIGQFGQYSEIRLFPVYATIWGE